MKRSYTQLVFALLGTVYFISIAYDPMAGSLLDIVDLPVHETGHLLFRIFGERAGIAGGSIFQVIFPAVFVAYFIWYRKYYSAAIVLFWVGQSILNVYVYAADAVRMQLVLTSGLTGSEGSFHDWNYLLSEAGLIGSVRTVAGIIRLAGTASIICAGAASVYFSFSEETANGDEDF